MHAAHTFLLLLFPFIHATNTCTPSHTSCAFYPCINALYGGCGPNGYPRAFGTPICTAFARDKSQFSPAGRAWILAVRYCLQEALIPDVEHAAEESCELLQEHAFDSHVRCYVKSGYCKLPEEDKVQVGKVVASTVLKNATEVAKEAVEIEERCAEMEMDR